MNQYFRYKIKDEYLPDFIQEFHKKGIINQLPPTTASGWQVNVFDIYGIDIKYLRKIKIKSIERTISEEDKLVKYLLNQDFVIFLTKEEIDSIQKSYGPAIGKTGFSGVQGVAGYSGT